MADTRAFDEPFADPPYQRVEPKNRLHQHVDGGGEVIATADVAQFVSHDRVELIGHQPFSNPFG